jgi:hypothetical protein
MVVIGEIARRLQNTLHQDFTFVCALKLIALRNILFKMHVVRKTIDLVRISRLILLRFIWRVFVSSDTFLNRLHKIKTC